MKIKRFKDWREETKLMLFRIWFAGAVALFIGWTPIGGGENPSPTFIYQLIFMLALGLFISNILVVGPVTRLMFNTPRKNRYEDPVIKKILENILHFFAMIFIVILIWLSYFGINSLLELIGLSSSGNLPTLMFEPFSFALLYGFYFAIGKFVLDKLTTLKPVNNKDISKKEEDSNTEEES